MTAAEHSALRAKAEAATPGKWTLVKRCDNVGPGEACGVTSDQKTEYGHAVGIFQSDAYDECGHPVSLADAEYIAAASPSVVLTLLDELSLACANWQGADGYADAMRCERDHAVGEIHRLDLALAEARAEGDRMRPVYIAAKAWRPHRHRDVVGTAPLGGQRTETGVALIDAVDAALAAEAKEAK